MRHELVALRPAPSGWRAECSCGDVSRGPRRYVALERWHAHVVEMTGAKR